MSDILATANNQYISSGEQVYIEPILQEYTAGQNITIDENLVISSKDVAMARNLDYLWKKLKGIIYDTETLNGTSYQVSLPSGAMDYAEWQMIGGMSIVDGGSLKDAKVDKVVTKGVNVWNEYWELGSINTSTGQNASSTLRIRSVGYNEIKPNTEYYSYIVNNESTSLFWYDEDYNFISYIQAKNISVTSPSNAKYMRLIHATSTYNKNFMVSLNSNPIKESYVPYLSQEKAIPSAIQNLDGYGKGISSSCYNFIEQKTYSNMKYVDLGTLNWAYQSSSFRVANTNFPDLAKKTNLCSKYAIYNDTTTLDKTGYFGANNLVIYDSQYTSASAFKTAMDGVLLWYEANDVGEDYEAYVFHKKMGSRAYQSGDENNASYLTDMTTTYYPLDNEQMLDITQYTTQDMNIIQIQAYGTITNHYPLLDNGYGINMNSTTELMVEVSEV